MKILQDHEIRIELADIANLILVDRSYAVVDENYLRQSFIPWFLHWCREAGLQYESEARDCDKFARAFAAQAHFAAWRRKAPHTGAVGWMGARSGKISHAFNFARVADGWIEIEPQTGAVRPLRHDLSGVFYAVL